jgi:hypothetical protein
VKLEKKAQTNCREKLHKKFEDLGSIDGFAKMT